MGFSNFVQFFLVFAFMACNSNKGHTNEIENDPLVIPYRQYLSNLDSIKEHIDSADWNRAQALLYNTINGHLPSYWTGTDWGFNGTTQTPRSGSIACGYFLTTTIQQTGYDIKRVWMAQQASSVLIKAYCSDIKIMSSLEAVSKHLKTQKDSSCFIIGLDFHTGYITKDGDSSFIIHSNYIGNEGVIKEPIEKSAVLTKNKYFMIGSLSSRKDHLQKWMKW